MASKLQNIKIVNDEIVSIEEVEFNSSGGPLASQVLSTTQDVSGSIIVKRIATDEPTSISVADLKTLALGGLILDMSQFTKLALIIDGPVSGLLDEYVTFQTEEHAFAIEASQEIGPIDLFRVWNIDIIPDYNLPSMYSTRYSNMSPVLISGDTGFTPISNAGPIMWLIDHVTGSTNIATTHDIHGAWSGAPISYSAANVQAAIWTLLGQQSFYYPSLVPFFGAYDQSITDALVAEALTHPAFTPTLNRPITIMQTFIGGIGRYAPFAFARF